MNVTCVFEEVQMAPNPVHRVMNTLALKTSPTLEIYMNVNLTVHKLKIYNLPRRLDTKTLCEKLSWLHISILCHTHRKQRRASFFIHQAKEAGTFTDNDTDNPEKKQNSSTLG
jgi:hypothetical protein